MDSEINKMRQQKLTTVMLVGPNPWPNDRGQWPEDFDLFASQWMSAYARQPHQPGIAGGPFRVKGGLRALSEICLLIPQKQRKSGHPSTLHLCQEVKSQGRRVHVKLSSCRTSIIEAGSAPWPRMRCTASSTQATLVVGVPSGASSRPTRI
jgi:hypothetical protein